jgi:hypothetical protein|tara:strand:- start:210 stop:461 length:252 start_codon:yes stop_codon:yes gene_type:complete
MFLTFTPYLIDINKIKLKYNSMFYENNIDFSAVGEVVSLAKDKCPNSSCFSELVDYLQEQIEFLEEEAKEREGDLDLYNSYEE